MAKRRDRGRDVLSSEGGFLGKWKARAAERRVRLRDVLAQPPGDPAKARERVRWLERTSNAIAGRRKWLEVRLEHVVGLQTILEEALAGVPRGDGGHRPVDENYSPDDLIADPETDEYPRRS